MFNIMNQPGIKKVFVYTTLQDAKLIFFLGITLPYNFFNYKIFFNMFFILTQVKSHLQTYPCPTNINFLWNFGFLAGVTFFLQIFTGLLLASRYTAELSHAFLSVQHIVREVVFGWQFRFFHATGASLVFVCLFMHMMRALVFNSFVYLPQTWLTGIAIFGISIVTAFLGYVLPWGQMSFWGATVICNLLTPIPYLVTWLLGGFYVDHPTLKRFFVLHFVLPFTVMAIVILHIFYLHLHGSNNPLGNETPLKVPFFPVLLGSDAKGLQLLITVLILQSCFGILELSHPDNNIPVNRFVTPLQIVPEWYFLAYYAILKVIPSKTGGTLIVVASFCLMILFSEVRAFSTVIALKQHFAARNTVTTAAINFIYTFMCLIIIGAQLPQETFIKYGRLFTINLFKSSMSTIKNSTY